MVSILWAKSSRYFSTFFTQFPSTLTWSNGLRSGIDMATALFLACSQVRCVLLLLPSRLILDT